MITALLILAFTFTDTATTLFGLTFAGGVELNPVYHAVTPPVFWAVKWIVAIFFAALSWRARNYMSREWRIILWAGTMIPAAASFSNAINLAIWSWGLA